jgi:hypothetical protein
MEDYRTERKANFKIYCNVRIPNPDTVIGIINNPKTVEQYKLYQNYQIHLINF